jgi:hypothetical protein
MDMAEEARQRRLVLGLLSKIVDANLREFWCAVSTRATKEGARLASYDSLERGHELDVWWYSAYLIAKIWY